MEQNRAATTGNQEIYNHRFFRHFVLYSLAYVMMGQIFTALGPMFPYLSAKQNRLETEYSTLLVFRSVGFVIGALIMNIYSDKFSHHQKISMGILIMGSFSIVFNTTQNLYVKGVYVALSSLGCSMVDVAVNLATMECFSGQNLPSWLQVLHGTFGVGGLLGPYMVYLFELNCLIYLGIISWILIVFLMILPTPQIVKKEHNQGKSQNENEQGQTALETPVVTIYMMAITFLFQVGQQTSYGGWISSYSVLKEYSNKEHATFYSSLYWGSMTVFRFIFAAASGSPTQKVKRLAISAIITTFLYFVIKQINIELSLILTSILYGASNSVVFPLLLSVHQQYGFKPSSKDTSFFIMLGALGQGCIAVFIGKLMQYVSYDSLLYSMGVINIVVIILVRQSARILEKHQSQSPNILQRLIKSHETELGQIKVKPNRQFNREINKF